MKLSSGIILLSSIMMSASGFVAPSSSTFTSSSLQVATDPTAIESEMDEGTPVVALNGAGRPKRTRQERLEAASKGLEAHVVGLSIHHASVEVREKLAIAEADWNSASADLIATGSIAEAAVLSTCNRFEVYYTAADAREAMAAVTQYLSNRAQLPVSLLRQNIFMLSSDDAVWHLMRVAGGLDSLVVGEGQILSQVRQCHLHSIEEDGSGGKVLSRLLQSAVQAGKRVRSETAISKGSVSISSAAVELSEMLCSQDLQLPFSEARLAVVGAGKMTRLLLTHLASRGLEQITIVNRSRKSPEELAEQFPDVQVDIKLMDDLWDVVANADIVYTATSAVDYLVDKGLLEENGLGGGKPLMLVDIAVPRNVGTDCNEVPNVVAYNVDDLKAVVARNTAMRQKEMIEAETLLQEESAAFCGWRESLSAIPTINQLQERANEFRTEELKKCSRKLGHLNDNEMEAVERLSRGIVNKLLHGPMTHLRKTESIEGKQATLKELSAMFRLDEKDNAGRNGRRRN